MKTGGEIPPCPPLSNWRRETPWMWMFPHDSRSNVRDASVALVGSVFRAR